METKEANSSGGNQKFDQKSSTQLRTKSIDNDNKTDDNTPKSNRINIFNFLMKKSENNGAEKSLERPNHSLSTNVVFDQSIGKHFNQNVTDKSISKSMNDLYKSKMMLNDASPDHAFGLLKKDSSVGDSVFDLGNTPNIFQNKDRGIGFCEEHLKANLKNMFVLDDEEMMNDELPGSLKLIPDFQLSNKHINPFEADLQNAEDEHYDTPKLGEDGEDPNDDPFEEMFSPQKKAQEPNVAPSGKEPVKLISKFHKISSDIQKSEEKPVLCGKKQKSRKSPVKGESNKIQISTKLGVIKREEESTKNGNEAIRKRDEKRTEKLARSD